MTLVVFLRPVTPSCLGQGPRQVYGLPSHISKTVLSTVKIGPCFSPLDSYQPNVPCFVELSRHRGSRLTSQARGPRMPGWPGPDTSTRVRLLPSQHTLE